MENFIVCINAVLPVFLVMLTGYACRRLKIIDYETIRKMNKVSFTMFLSVMIFNNIYQSDISTAFKPKLIAFAVCMAVLSAVLTSLYIVKRIKDKKKHSVIIIGIFRSNFAIIGLPLVKSLCPNEDSSAIAILVAIIVCVYNVLSVILLQTLSERKTTFSKVAIGIIKNPLIIGTIVGLVFMLLQIKLPYFVEKSVKDLAEIASPLMIFLLGAFFDFSGIKKNIRYITIAALGKLVAMPLFILSIAVAAGFRGIELAGLIGMSATSSAVSSFTMAQQMNGDAELAGQIIVITSFLCPFTVFVWSILLKNLGFI